MSYNNDLPPVATTLPDVELQVDSVAYPRLRIGEFATRQIEHEQRHDLDRRFDDIRVAIETALALIAVFPNVHSTERYTARARFRQEFAIPLYQLYKQYIELGSPQGDFVELIAGQDDERRGLVSWQLRSAIALESFQTYLQDEGVSYRDPTDLEMGSGATIVVEDFPVRCDMVPVAVSADTKKYDLRPSISMKCINLGIPFKAGLPTQGATQAPISGAHAQGLATIRKTQARRARIAEQRQRAAQAVPRQQIAVPKRTPNEITSEAVRLQKKIERAKAVRAQREARTRKEQMVRLATARVPTMYERTDVIASLPGHFMNRQTAHEGAPSFRGEQLALEIIDQAKLWGHANMQRDSRALMRKRIMQTIDPEDSAHMNALRRLAATICLPSSKNSFDLGGFVRSLNDALKVNELHDFVVTIKELAHYRASATEVADYARATITTLYGLGLEQTVEKLARSSGYTVVTAAELSEELGIDVDHIGIDLLIDGVPFDIKSNHRDAIAHAQKYARATSRFHVVKFVPPLTDKYFDGELIIPDRNVAHALATTDFCQMIDTAVEQYLGMELPDDLAEHEATTAEQRMSERARHQTAYDELDRLALDATRYWRRRVSKLAESRWTIDPIGELADKC